jgi:beta-galactosidase
MKIGAYYYPEQWPREQWARDFDNMAGMGLQIVHMGEFAWFDMEPKAGEIRLDWLSECVETAAKRRMQVILCTPTAVPPNWLVQEHPEILLKHSSGASARVGGRRHYSPTAPAYHEATRRIVGALADRFGNHPAVMGWQIDNEYGAPFDQNDHAHAAFRQWLKERYGSLESLNRAWGCQFWSTYYTDWAQVMFPPSRDPVYGNPHQHLDASRFWSWAFARFNKIQAEILRPKIGERFLTTNFMNFYPDVNPADMFGDLNLMSWDAYPVTGWDKSVKDETYRIADPASISFMHDYMCSFNGRWGQMELQPGQVNWSGVPVLLYPGTVRLWIWTAFAHGAEFVTTYRFRQPRFGIELFHHGLVGSDGITQTQGGREFAQTISEMKRIDPVAASQPNDDEPCVGLVFDFEQLWYFATLPQARRWHQPRWLQMWYAAITRLGLRVKILQPGQEWRGKLPLVVAPSVQMVDEGMIGQFEKYVDEGGHLVLTCRTGLMDRTGQLFEGPIGAPIRKLIGASIEAYDGLPDDTFGQLDMDGKKYPWGVWGDLLYAEPGTKVLAKYSDQFYTGAAAVTQRKAGTGVTTYCGVYSEQAFIDALVERLATQAKLPVNPLPPRVHIVRRGKYRILLNYQDKPVDAPAARGVKFLVGTRKVEPAGVAVWEE